MSKTVAGSSTDQHRSTTWRAIIIAFVLIPVNSYWIVRALTFFLMAMKTRFLWWPLHPIAYLLAGQEHNPQVWWPEVIQKGDTALHRLDPGRVYDRRFLEYCECGIQRPCL